MRPPPIKPEYGPPLPELLAPRWRRAARTTRSAVLAAAALLVVLIVFVVVATWPKSISHGGAVPFHFEYADHLHRSAPAPGDFARVEARSRGVLAASFAVGPLRLPPYAGDLEGELPLFAREQIARLAATYPHFALDVEGKIRNNNVPGYTIDFSSTLNGRPVFGRVALLFPDHAHQRDGLRVTMLERPNSQVTSPDRIAVTGDLKTPFTTFQLG
jgi:hypothetical protein